MPIRVPTVRVFVSRDGKRLTPPLGKPFSFTEDEVRQVNSVHPTALRMPLNEYEGVQAEAEVKPKPTSKKTTSSRRKSSIKPEPEPEAGEFLGSAHAETLYDPAADTGTSNFGDDDL